MYDMNEEMQGIIIPEELLPVVNEYAQRLNKDYLSCDDCWEVFTACGVKEKDIYLKIDVQNGVILPFFPMVDVSNIVWDDDEE